MDSCFSACRGLCSYQEKRPDVQPRGLDIRPLSYGFHKEGTKLSLTTSFVESLMCWFTDRLVDSASDSINTAALANSSLLMSYDDNAGEVILRYLLVVDADHAYISRH